MVIMVRKVIDMTYTPASAKENHVRTRISMSFITVIQWSISLGRREKDVDTGSGGSPMDPIESRVPEGFAATRWRGGPQ
jgi:hypothetical protein